MKKRIYDVKESIENVRGPEIQIRPVNNPSTAYEMEEEAEARHGNRKRTRYMASHLKDFLMLNISLIHASFGGSTEDIYKEETIKFMEKTKEQNEEIIQLLREVRANQMLTPNNTSVQDKLQAPRRKQSSA